MSKDIEEDDVFIFNDKFSSKLHKALARALPLPLTSVRNRICACTAAPLAAWGTG